MTSVRESPASSVSKKPRTSPFIRLSASVSPGEYLPVLDCPLRGQSSANYFEQEELPSTRLSADHRQMFALCSGRETALLCHSAPNTTRAPVSQQVIDSL